MIPGKKARGNVYETLALVLPPLFVIINDMQTKMIERYFFFGLLLATFIFTFMIFKPFWIVLLLGISFSIVLYPLFRWFTKYHAPRWLASILTVIIFTIIVLGPISGVGILVFKQSQNVYQEVIEGHNISPYINSIDKSVQRILPEGFTL